MDKLTAYRAALRLQGGGKEGADVRPDFDWNGQQPAAAMGVR